MNQPSYTVTMRVGKVPARAVGVTFEFAPGTEVTGGTYHGRLVERTATRLAFRWPAGNGAPEGMLTVECGKQRPKLVATTWQSADGVLAPAAATAGNPFQLRAKYIAALATTDERRQPALDMCELDRRTDPTELDKQAKTRAIAASVRELTRHLACRYLQRASWSLRGLPFEPDRALEQKAQRHVDLVEPWYRGVLLAVFPGPRLPNSKERRFDLRRFERTFAAFVTGEIALGRLSKVVPASDPLALHGIPDGPNLFAFAESALLFQRRGKQPAFWASMLPVLVAGAEFFAAHYWNRTGRHLQAYQPQHLKIDVPRASFLAVLDQKHRAMAPSLLVQTLGNTVGLALRQDPAISVPDCTPKELQ